jgi:hypothetical protein
VQGGPLSCQDADDLQQRAQMPAFSLLAALHPKSAATVPAAKLGRAGASTHLLLAIALTHWLR